ncbi:MAG TPA: SDR family oxidoreductase [Gammaproteobacteria bacterium]|nr:SDR family oxidoreductase [Gammaproteobacteria bacterium]
MNELRDSTILITGAAGGIGSATARELGRAGASLLLTDVHAPALSELAERLASEGIDNRVIPVNLASAEDRAELVALASRLHVDTLVNIAGVNPFGWLAEQTPAEIELVFRINTVAPVLLCQAMLPVLAANAPARIVNVGSAFGALGYPGFAAYSASKFAMRGFSEALRRELADADIGVHYVAPRATRTQLVTDRVRAMNEALGIAMDPPVVVARAIAKTLRSGRRELALGLPERLFAWINALFPALVDRALARQLPTIRRFAARNPAAGEVRRPSAAMHST